MNNDATNNQVLTIGSKVRIEKGCKAKDITKGATAIVRDIKELGSEGGYFVKITLFFLNSYASGKTVSLYARHINRLSDTFINLNDGNPLHKITIRRV